MWPAAIVSARPGVDLLLLNGAALRSCALTGEVLESCRPDPGRDEATSGQGRMEVEAGIC